MERILLLLWMGLPIEYGLKDVCTSKGIALVCFCSVVQRTLIDVNLVVRHPFGIDILEIDSMRVQTVGGLGYVVDGSNINTTFT